jgi:hypothetical protein
MVVCQVSCSGVDSGPGKGLGDRGRAAWTLASLRWKRPRASTGSEQQQRRPQGVSLPKPEPGDPGGPGGSTGSAAQEWEFSSPWYVDWNHQEHKVINAGLDKEGKTNILYQFSMNKVVHSSLTIRSNVEEVVITNTCFLMGHRWPRISLFFLEHLL